MTFQEPYPLQIVAVELTPAQAPEIEQAVGEALGTAELSPDPWWQAGLGDALET